MDENNEDYPSKEVRSKNNVLNTAVPRKRVPRVTPHCLVFSDVVLQVQVGFILYSCVVSLVFKLLFLGLFEICVLALPLQDEKRSDGTDPTHKRRRKFCYFEEVCS